MNRKQYEKKISKYQNIKIKLFNISCNGWVGKKHVRVSTGVYMCVRACTVLLVCVTSGRRYRIDACVLYVSSVLCVCCVSYFLFSIKFLSSE